MATKFFYGGDSHSWVPSNELALCRPYGI